MTTSIPGIIITIKQVVNKMKRWSIKLNEVVDMMNTSGFGWDDARKCVIVDSEQKHPKLGNHANKEFKEFERLQGIFGKDRANGRGAETTEDVLEGLNDDTNNVIETDLELDEEHTSAAPTENHMSNRPNVSRPPLKRQKMLDVANKFIENMDNYMSAARSDILLIVKKMPDPPMARNLGEEVKKLGLSEDEEVDLMIKFSHKPEYEKYFWELNGVQRISFVKKIMGLP
ncbi:hypothetical protein IHE45_05G080600 [Dioscorea alata]|uniref:Uncharacterized protein n=1 Tax=Dioscorea alata TaxID=55571 RepID=A0ACB7W2X6_DIOAL|nr:hypothetical protein IHE45_05G080600 [Dioscorea alata]